MKKLIYILFTFGWALLLTSCEDNLLEGARSYPVDAPVVPANAGDADFSNFISLGNSLTAGFMDGALYNRGQQNAFPNLLAKQMAEVVGGGASTGFNQPDINSENGFFGTGPGGIILGRLRLVQSSPTASPTPAPIIPGEIPAAYAGDRSQLNNFGVPGILLGQALIPDTGNPASPAFNPLYARFASAPGTSTILTDAIATNPTFFSFWLGSNDVLGYAISGATNDAIFTEPAAFDFQYRSAITALLSTDAQGVVANIPFVTDIPYFKLVPNNALALTAEQATQLNAGYAAFNAGVDAWNAVAPAAAQRTKISFSAGANLFVIRDDELPTVPGLPSIRQMNASELVGLTIPQDSILYWHSTPVAADLGVPDQYILTDLEQSEIIGRTNVLNQIIADVVSENSDDLAMVDINQLFKDFAEGGVSREYNVTIDPGVAPPFGMFSLDGVHPNARGHAWVANKFIDVINAKWGSTLKYVPLETSPINDFPVAP